MEHPNSPMGAMPLRDGRGPHSPPSDGRRPGEPYRPPPGYGHGPPGYAPYPGYGGPPQSPYGGHPSQPGYPSRGPPGSYPPGPGQPPSSYYPYPPGSRGPPFSYADGMYGGQQPNRQSPNFRPGPGHPPPSQGSPMMGQPPHKVASSPSPKSSPNRSPGDGGAALRVAPKIAHQVEVERLRAAAAAELTHEEVKPIQSDFHFFAKENAAKYRPLAEEEVRKSLKEGETLDPFLVNSNLNSRLVAAWEEMTKEQRENYMIKEEEDRRRFMEEDEIASRHCATLTARGKSPRTTEKTGKGEAEETTPIKAEELEDVSGEKNGTTETAEAEAETAADTSMEENAPKRAADEVPEEEGDPKRNRVS